MQMLWFDFAYHKFKNWIEYDNSFKESFASILPS